VISAAAPAAAAPRQYDVELVPAPTVAATAEQTWWPLRRRDWALLGIGAGVTAILGGIILAIVRLAT
jgi:hypothetical protein